MKNIFAFLCLLTISANLQASIDELSDEALRIYYSGDRGRALAIFADIYSKDSTHAEAVYQLAVSGFSQNKHAKDKFLESTQEAATVAFSSGNDGLGFYIKAQVASKIGESEKALIEIEEALKIEPHSVRYLRAKMLFLIKVADKTYDYDILSQAITVSEQALLSVDKDPKKYFTKGAIHFEIGRWLPPASQKVHKRKIRHFKKALELGGISEITVSYSWNNMSLSLYQIGECVEAKRAAEKALDIATYGYANVNLDNANHCLADGNIFLIYWYKFETFCKAMLRKFMR